MDQYALQLAPTGNIALIIASRFLIGFVISNVYDRVDDALLLTLEAGFCAAVLGLLGSIGVALPAQHTNGELAIRLILGACCR